MSATDPKHTYTTFGGYTTCNDCGAFAPKGKPVIHYANCIPGDSERWREYYNQPELPADADREYEEYLKNDKPDESS